MEEKLRNAKEHSTHRVNIDKFKKDVFNRIEGNQQKSSTRFLIGQKRIAAVALTLVILPSVAFAGYYYYADQIFGSSSNLANLGGEEEWYKGFESDLQFAESVLDDEEFERFLSLVKEIAPYHLKITTEHNGDPNLLSQEEFSTYNQLNEEIQPYYTKIDKARMEQIESEVSPTVPEESQKLVSFRIVTPTYMPKGYSFDQAHWGHDITLKFSNEKENITSHQSELKNSQLTILDDYKNIEEYTLEGFETKYGEGEQQNGLAVLIPQTAKYKASKVYITGNLSKEDLEKIALSMIAE